MPLDPSIIGRFNKFDDYVKANQEFEQQKRMREEQIKTAQQQRDMRKQQMQIDMNKKPASVQEIEYYQQNPEAFDMYKQMQQAKSTPLGSRETAYMRDAQTLLESNPELGLERAYSLARGGAGQGMYYNPSTGMMEPMQGYVEGARDIEYGKTFGRKQSESDVERITDFPQAESNIGQATDLLNRIEKHPGFSASVGMPNPLKGNIPFIGKVAGSPAADFDAVMKQLEGKNFLEAFETLKGGGHITEIEGQKATEAIAALATSQSESQFLENLAIYRNILETGLDRKKRGIVVAKERAGIQQPMEQGGDDVESLIERYSR